MRKDHSFRQISIIIISSHRKNVNRVSRETCANLALFCFHALFFSSQASGSPVSRGTCGNLGAFLFSRPVFATASLITVVFHVERPRLGSRGVLSFALLSPTPSLHPPKKGGAAPLAPVSLSSLRPPSLSQQKRGGSARSPRLTPFLCLSLLSAPVLSSLRFGSLFSPLRFSLLSAPVLSALPGPPPSSPPFAPLFLPFDPCFSLFSPSARLFGSPPFHPSSSRKERLLGSKGVVSRGTILTSATLHARKRCFLQNGQSFFDRPFFDRPPFFAAALEGDPTLWVDCFT